MIQYDLFGGSLKDQGMQSALSSSAALPWRDRAMAAIEMLAERKQPFTSEDVVAAVGLPRASEANANNAVGAVMSLAARRRLIRPIGYVQARRDVSHARVLRQWEGQPS
jgi:hypothetical protein